MRRVLVSLASVAVLFLATFGVGLAQAKPEFKLGFLTLAEAIPEVAGEAVDGERYDPATGNSLQQTTRGLMVWRKADNWTAFTDGNRTWINGPNGVQERGNDERFDWEKVADTPPQQPQPIAAGPTDVPATVPSAPPLPATMKVSIDRPVEGTHTGFDLKVTGWALSTDAAGRPWNGIEEFKAFLDGPEGSGKPLSIKVNRIARPDVGSSLGNPAFSNSGFSLEFNQAELPQGRHTLYLYLRSATSGWWWKPITFAAGYPGDWTLYDRSGDGFQISLPPGWPAVDLMSRDLAGEFRRVFKDNPEVSSKLSSLLIGGMVLQWMGGEFVSVPAAEATLPNPLATHAKLMALPVDAPNTLDEAAQFFANLLDSQVRAGTVRSVSQRRVSLPAGDAAEFTYLQTAGDSPESATTLAVLDYAILHDGVFYEMVFSCPAERFDQYRPIFDRIVRSLKFVPRVEPGAQI